MRKSSRLFSEWAWLQYSRRGTSTQDSFPLLESRSCENIVPGTIQMARFSIFLVDFLFLDQTEPPLCSTASFLTMYAIQRWAVRRTLWCHDVDPPDLPLSTYLHRLDSWRAQNRTFSRKKLSELCSRYFQRTFPLVQGYRSSYSRRGNIHPVFFSKFMIFATYICPRFRKSQLFS